MDKNVPIYFSIHDANLAEMTMRDPARARGASLCPVDNFQAMVSGKYKLRIVWDLQDGARRYGEIKRGLLRGKMGTAEIAARVLSRELKALADLGVVARHDFGEIPPKVEYCLTPLGRSLVPVIAAMHKWGKRHLVPKISR
jgi:DNA-binding HxlR family transcriptional regulator